MITEDYLSGNETGNDIIELVPSYNDSDKARISILVVSCEKDQSKRTAFLRNAVNDFIVKPFVQDELILRAFVKRF